MCLIKEERDERMERRIKKRETVVSRIKFITTLKLARICFMMTIISIHAITTNSKTIQGVELYGRGVNGPGGSMRSSGQVPVIDGVIGGGDPDDERNRPANRFRVYTHLITTDETANTNNNTTNNNTTSASNTKPFVQVTANVSVCPSNNSVQTHSMTGYIHLNQSRSLFFWFLQARKDPDQAPLILWLNGGPGSSSMIGLFQENGPCRIKLDSSGFDANMQSWNDIANMIYIDQPVATGYSYGSSRAKSTAEAMVDLYEALQLFLSDKYFSRFVSRPFGVWAESYGGHYAPVLVDYILQMNRDLSNRNQSTGIPIPINSLGIGNGLTNAYVQYLSYITYAKSNPYNQTLVSKEVIETALKDFNTPITGCHDLIKNCQTTLKAYDCRSAQSFCNRQILSALVGSRDVYDVRQLDPSPYPPSLEPILNDPKFKTSIGVPPTVNWTESNEDIYMDFFSSGDWMLDSSKQLERVINAGVRTLIYAGDADFIVNYQGVESLVTSLNTKLSSSFNNQSFSNWVVDDELAGVYKTWDTLSYLRVFESGHEVPAYGKGKLPIGRAAKVFFDETISNRSISSSRLDQINPAQSTVDKSAASSLRLHYSSFKFYSYGLLFFWVTLSFLSFF